MAQRSSAPVEPFSYVLKADCELPADQQSRFTFRPLTQAERMRYMDGMSVMVNDGGTKQLRFRNLEQSREIVILTLTGAENFPAGSPVGLVEDATREQREKYVELIEDLDVYELGQYAFDHSTLGAPEKNSSRPSLTPN